MVCHPRWLRAEHPVIAAFTGLEYDAITLGNHEFDYGVTALSQRIGETMPPVVSCNITRVDHVAPWTILEHKVTLPSGSTEELRIGITGFAHRKPPNGTPRVYRRQFSSHRSYQPCRKVA